MHTFSSQEAAESLGKRLQANSWYVSICLEDLPGRIPPSSTLVVYVASKHPDQDNIVSDWMGFHVRVVVSGRPKPA